MEQGDTWRVWNEDCFDHMAITGDGFYDLIVTSPPYNMNLRVNAKGDGYTSRQIVPEISTKYDGFDDNLPMDEYRQFLVELFRESTRVSKLAVINIQMLTGNKPALLMALGECAELVKEIAVWDKKHGQPAIGEGVFNSRYEFIIFLGNKPITRSFIHQDTGEPMFPKGTIPNVWEVRNTQSADPDHGAVFPVQLCEHIIRSFSREGDHVFDPFTGTGTTGIAAVSLNRQFTGTEISQHYTTRSRERIASQSQQQFLL